MQRTSQLLLCFIKKKYSPAASKKIDMITGLNNSQHSSSQYVPSWRTKIQTLCYKHNKAILMILLWHCANSLTYYLLLEPSYLIQKLNRHTAKGMICFETILAFSPLAGLLADVVYGRFKVLKCSTYILLASEILTYSLFRNILISFGQQISWEILTN